MKKLILISGKAQHGKDFTANTLKGKLELQDQKVLIVHYGDYVKSVCRDYFGWNGNKDEKGREILQKIGTDKARKNNPNIWVTVINELIKALAEDYDYILIPDTRFPNEINFMIREDYDVVSVRVNRIGFESTLTDEQKLHSSETALDKFNFDYYMNCETGYDSVHTAVEKLIKEVI